MSGDGTYAPKSPDLSAIYSRDPACQPQSEPRQPQPLAHQGLLSQPSSQLQLSPPHLHLQPPSTVFFPGPPVNALYSHAQQPHQLATSPQSQSLGLPHSSVHFSPQTHAYYPSHPAPVTPSYPVQAPPLQQQQQVQLQSYLDSNFDNQRFYQGQNQAPDLLQAQYAWAQEQYNPPIPQTHRGQPPPSRSEPVSPSGTTSTMPPRRAAAQAVQPAIEPSPVKTKFPTARIKRIMQADEEVGKVAQQTPIAVGKALELFMVALVTKSADVAREKNSKRVSAQMLKQVVESDDRWDFLREIVGKVENEDKASKSGGRTKAESESEEESIPEKEKPEKKEKKTRAARKKKA